jgi:Tfp pilus assembly protein PilV
VTSQRRDNEVFYAAFVGRTATLELFLVRRNLEFAAWTGASLWRGSKRMQSPHQHSPYRGPQAGVSLLEILIATSILFGAVVVLAELAQIGRRHAESTSERVIAQQLCQQKLNELILGLLPITSASAPLEDAPGWAYRVEVEPLQDFEELDDLVRVHVVVEQDPQTPEMARRRNMRSFRLTRWIRTSGPSELESPNPSLAVTR